MYMDNLITYHIMCLFLHLYIFYLQNYQLIFILFRFLSLFFSYVFSFLLAFSSLFFFFFTVVADSELFKLTDLIGVNLLVGDFGVPSFSVLSCGFSSPKVCIFNALLIRTLFCTIACLRLVGDSTKNFDQSRHHPLSLFVRKEAPYLI